jgi:hypothetical protein
MNKHFYIFRDEYKRGLMGYYVQILNALYRYNTEETPVLIDLKECTPYFDNNMPNKNVWEYYFEQPNNQYDLQTIYEQEKYTKSSFMDKFEFIFHLSDENIKIIREIVKKYIKIKPHIIEKVNTFYNNQMKGYNILGVHKRGTDHYTIGHAGGQQHLMNCDYFFSLIDNIKNDFDKIYLITDETEAVINFKNHYGDKIIHYDDVILAPKNDNKGIHNGVGRNQPYKMGEDVIIESFLLSKTNLALLVASSVSNASISFNENLNFKYIDNHIKYG